MTAQTAISRFGKRTGGFPKIVGQLSGGFLRRIQFLRCRTALALPLENTESDQVVDIPASGVFHHTKIVDTLGRRHRAGQPVAPNDGC